MIFAAGQDENGWAVLGRASPDGVTVVTNWVTLTNETDTLRGSIHLDQTGVWDGEVVVVTGEAFLQAGGRGVWRVNSQGRAQLVTRSATQHLEGAITLPADPARWGPWSGRLVTGDETRLDDASEPQPFIYALNSDGVVAIHSLGVQPEDFDIIQPGQNLYCSDAFGGDERMGRVLTVSSNLLTNYAEDLLVTQAGEYPGGAKLLIFHWNGDEFVIRALRHPQTGAVPYDPTFEHTTFAPIAIPTTH